MAALETADNLNTIRMTAQKGCLQPQCCRFLSLTYPKLILSMILGLKTSVIDNSDVSMAVETPPIKSLQNLTLGTCREHRLLSTPGLSSSR